MNLAHERIALLCARLHLPEIGANWSALADESARIEQSLAEFLERLLLVEATARDQRVRETMLRLATLPSIKTIEQYDFAFASGAPKAQIQQLSTLAFI